MVKRAHIGNGQIYLDRSEGWTNVDTADSGAALAKDKPAFVDKWRTSEHRYYEKVDQARGNIDVAEDRIRHPKFNPVLTDRVTDLYGSWERLPFRDGELDEILSRQVFEHLSRRESQQAMEEARRCLKLGGILRLDVPDHTEALNQFADLRAVGKHKEADFMLSHLVGSAKHHWAFHMGSWTHGDLDAFVRPYGFRFLEEEPNIHSYPAFCLRWEKVPYDPQKHHPVHNLYEPSKRWLAAWQYAGDPIGTPIQVPDDWTCVEIGPGKQPWPRANIYIDCEEEFLAPLAVPRKACIISRIGVAGDKLIYFPKKNEFALISHCLEHVEDPRTAAEQISAIAKSGVVVCPSIWKEAIFNHHESDHKWFVLPPGKSGALRFLPIDRDWRDRMLDPLCDGSMTGVEFSKVMHQLLRLPCLGLREYGDCGRKFFEHAEPHLDVIHHWRGELRVEVLE